MGLLQYWRDYDNTENYYNKGNYYSRGGPFCEGDYYRRGRTIYGGKSLTTEGAITIEEGSLCGGRATILYVRRL